MTLTTQPQITTNEQLAYRVLNAAIERGVEEFCVCSGSRNSPFIIALAREASIKKFYWFEERSAAFFAIGRSKTTQRPVAIITTSGTATAELLPATMEAHYTGTPILLITADRPRRFRGTGAPQSAEQEGLYSSYVNNEWDIAHEEHLDLTEWKLSGPAHLNVCFEEPGRIINQPWEPVLNQKTYIPFKSRQGSATKEDLDQFINSVKSPLIVVSTLPEEAKENVCRFLLELNAPVVLEGVSKLREDPRLQHLRVLRTEQLWKHSSNSGYSIDGILRIGGVPTIRLWRDLEDATYNVPVFSINDVPFSGLSRGKILSIDLAQFFSEYKPPKTYKLKAFDSWKSEDNNYYEKLLALIKEEPLAEASLFYSLSKIIPKKSLVYLGNSLPLREWDQAAINDDRNFDTHARRGANGIDGQISTFFGLCTSKRDNWAIIGDLTALYDMVAPWIIPQIEEMNINLVIVNNSGGKFFARMYDDKEFLNSHNLHFEHLAGMWNLSYEKWTHVPSTINKQSQRKLIEIVPDNDATARYWKRLADI